MYKAKAPSPEHVRNEAAADQAYRRAGIRVPDCRIYEENGITYKLSEYIAGVQSLGDYMAHATPAQRQAVIDELKQGYIVDALFANWDVLGSGQDNVLIDKDGHAWRIDNGSSFGFRAMGEKKKPEEFDRREWPDDWRTIRSSGINSGVFDKLTAHDIFSSKVDLDAVVSGLPEETKKALAKPLEELKQMQSRCTDFDRGGILPEHTSTALEATYDFSKEGFREEVPRHISLGAFGFCRSSGFAGAQNPSGLPDYSQFIKEAAISINAHTGFGKNPADYTPNQGKVEAALKLKPELEKYAKTDSNAKKLLGYLTEIENAQAAGWHITSPISQVKSLVVTPPNVASATPKKYKSLTDHLYDKAQRDGVDVGIIADYYKAQGSDSWSGHAGEACRLKILDLSLRGVDISSPGPAVYAGTGRRKKYYDEQVKFYKDNPAQFEHDKKALLYWRSATSLLFENADFSGNDRDGHFIYSTRTDDGARFSGMTIGKVNPAYQIGACESGSVFESVSIYTDGVIGVRRIPYSRINAVYFMDGKPHGSAMFANDHEKEVSADLVGLPVYYPGASGTGWDIGNHKKEIDAAFAEWDKANPSQDNG